MNLLDVRIAERNIKKGLLSRKAFNKHIKELEDVTDKSEPVSERQPLEPKEDAEE
ncbi:MAG: hypothetical protein ABI333_21040 [bacterium]